MPERERCHGRVLHHRSPEPALLRDGTLGQPMEPLPESLTGAKKANEKRKLMTSPEPARTASIYREWVTGPHQIYGKSRKWESVERRGSFPAGSLVFAQRQDDLSYGSHVFKMYVPVQDGSSSPMLFVIVLQRVRGRRATATGRGHPCVRDSRFIY